MIRRCNCLLKWSLFKCHVSFRGCNATFSVFQVNMLQVFNFEWPDCMTPILSKASRVSNLGDFEEPSLVVEGTGSTLSHMPFDFFEFTRKFGWSIFLAKEIKNGWFTCKITHLERKITHVAAFARIWFFQSLAPLGLVDFSALGIHCRRKRCPWSTHSKWSNERSHFIQ